MIPDMRIHISEVKSHAGKEVEIAGFVQTIRDQKKIKFLIVRDISGVIQAVVFNNDQALKTVESLTLESVVRISGLAKEEKQAPGGVELVAENIEVLSLAAPELPIPVIEKTGEVDQSKRMDWRFLDLRKPEKQLIFQVWTELERSFIDYCVEQGYIEIHSPKLMSSPSEGGAEVFEVKYFDRKAYLAQSPQFYKQMAMAAGFEKVFEVGPVFRAEPSFTSRHATEFSGFDLEKSYIDSHQDVMEEEGKMLAFALQRIKDKYGEKIKEVCGVEVTVPTVPFPQLTVAEAKKVLAKLEVPSEKDGDFSPEEERAIGEYIKKEQGHEFVFLTEYPAAGRAFYHMRLEGGSDLTRGFDLLWSGLEITTGAQREHRYEVLVRQAQERGIGLESIQFYLNFFKYGCPPHGGFGAGPERMIMKLLNLESIREASYLYRGVKRLEP